MEIRQQRLEKLNNKFTWYRLSLFFSGLFISLLLFFFTTDLISMISFVVFILSFAILTHFHGRLIQGLDKLKKWINVKKINIARMNLDWQKIPQTSDYNERENPVEIDLNLTGSHSLFHLINLSISRQGKNLLGKWLLNKKPVKEEIYERQKLVKELTPHFRLRDRLSLIAAMSAKKDFNGEILLDWIKNFEPQKSVTAFIIILSLLAVVNISLFIIYIYANIPAYWLISLLLYIAIYYFGNSNKKLVFGQLEFISEELNKFSSILKLMESYPYPENSKLKELCSCYFTKNELPSALIAKMESSISILRMRSGNPFVWTMIRGVFPIDYYYIQKVNKYKSRILENFPAWLDTFYYVDALNSLAGFAYLNPEYNFPEIKDIDDYSNQIFEAELLGHPLLNKEKKICNSFTFSKLGEIAVITGSNMSGKSTFLRTLGVNICLAYSGGPVNAHKLILPRLRIFTCIKVSDSVVDGISYFYAEVKRLKELLEQINEKNKLPVFFLIDEIFRGTNNIERLKGSRAFIKALSRSNSTGAVATHDLELIKLEQEISSLKNYHFKEEINNDKMVFDYQIHPGPCPTTNALKIMKMEGLPIE